MAEFRLRAALFSGLRRNVLLPYSGGRRPPLMPIRAWPHIAVALVTEALALIADGPAR